jgi:hypothetical protein
MEGHIEEISIAEIHEGLVRVPSAVVFDWDNTLKQYDSARRSIRVAWTETSWRNGRRIGSVASSSSVPYDRRGSTWKPF